MERALRSKKDQVLIADFLFEKAANNLLVPVDIGYIR